MKNDFLHLLTIGLNTLLFAALVIMGVYLLGRMGLTSPSKLLTGNTSPTPTPVNCFLLPDSTSITKITRGKLLDIQLKFETGSAGAISQIMLTVKTKRGEEKFNYSDKQQLLRTYINNSAVGSLSGLSEFKKDTDIQIEETYNTGSGFCPNLSAIHIVNFQEPQLQ